MNLVHTVRENLFFNAIKALASANALELNAESVGQLATLRKQFKGNVNDGGSLNFAIYKYVIHRLANNLPV